MTSRPGSRLLARRLTLAMVAVSALGAPSALAGATHHARAGQAAATESYPVPASGSYDVSGRGYGHGHGMSQWGAYGAARSAGLTAAQILAFYYPGTTVTTVPAVTTIRVLLSAVPSGSTGDIRVDPADGLAVTVDGESHPLPVASPKGHTYTRWRLQAVSGSLRLQGKRLGTWQTTLSDIGTRAGFHDSAHQVSVVVPVGSATRTTVYRGTIRAELGSGSLAAVNVVRLDGYLRSVTPAEMPASWTPAAVQAQAVAARSYAAHGMSHPKTPWWDVDGDTRDQAYPGIGSESPASDAAVAATAGQVLVDGSGSPILAQFGSADGGWTVSGGVAYLPAKKDPYDGLVPNGSHAWTTSLAASRVVAAYPALAKLKRIEITGRDGHGAWGGRITAMRLVGTKATLTVSGSSFEFAVGLRSPWWKPAEPAAG